MYTHTAPPCSRTAYAPARTLLRKPLSTGSVGMSTHWPLTSNFQPW